MSGNGVPEDGGTGNNIKDATGDTGTSAENTSKISFFTSIIAVFQFFTILPLGSCRDYEAFPRRLYLSPLAGWLVGAAGGAVFLLFMHLNMRIFAAAAAAATIMVLYGFNHFDGVLDLGDGLMAHTSREKRIKALTDQNIGAGGTACGMFLILLTVAAVISIPAESVFFALIIAEVAAKYVQVLFLVFGRPLREGMFSYLHSFAKRRFAVYALIICLPLLLLPIAPSAYLGAAIGALAVFFVLKGLSYRLFGGVNGDITGAANELTRLVVLTIIAAIAGLPADIGAALII
ncbi:MAG: adenosylcobinamide-GDP ribazoletransferase [Methanomicrobium sp.]|nr:adenosylcobinamide-GDP ribazoletransferase [Methanomicrobium sp.]